MGVVTRAVVVIAYSMECLWLCCCLKMFFFSLSFPSKTIFHNSLTLSLSLYATWPTRMSVHIENIWFNKKNSVPTKDKKRSEGTLIEDFHRISYSRHCCLLVRVSFFNLIKWMFFEMKHGIIMLYCNMFALCMIWYVGYAEYVVCAVCWDFIWLKLIEKTIMYWQEFVTF